MYRGQHVLLLFTMLHVCCMAYAMFFSFIISFAHWLLVWPTGMMTVHFTLLHSLLYKMIQMVWTTCITSRPAFFIIWQCRYNTWSAIQHKHNEVITNSVIQTNISDSCQYPVASPCSYIMRGRTFCMWRMYLLHFNTSTVAQKSWIPLIKSALVLGSTS